MLDELLKYERLGNKDELLFFLFEGISSDEMRLSHLRDFCINKKFSIARSFDAIIRLCELISLLEIEDNIVHINKDVFDPSSYDRNTYFNDFHFFKILIDCLSRNDLISSLFNEDNTRYSHKERMYFVIESKIPYKLFNIKNLLFSLGFFVKGEQLDHLYINKTFNTYFSEYLEYSHDKQTRVHKKMSIQELRDLNAKKELLGKEAELVALNYEISHMQDHPSKDMIRLISDDNVNAGYDIESFLDRESIFINKYIEVKSYSGDVVSFYWSKNEIEVAKKYQGQYFLYLINRDTLSENDHEPLIIQNPYNRVYMSDLWLKNPQSWHITYNDI